MFTATGHHQARAMAQDAPVFAYVHLLHTFDAAVYTAPGAFPFRRAEGELLSGSAALNVAGEPSVRWYARDPRFNAYHTDPELVDPVAWARLVAEWATVHYPVDGLFLDYLAEEPWTYPEDPDLELEDGGLAWRSWQVRAVWALKQHAPGLILLANGPWAVKELGWTRGGRLVDSVFLEKCGTLWWDPDVALSILSAHQGPQERDHRAPGSNVDRWRRRHVVDCQEGPRAAGWNLEHVARAAGAVSGFAWSTNRSGTD